jgi:hypothetical protein
VRGAARSDVDVCPDPTEGLSLPRPEGVVRPTARWWLCFAGRAEERRPRRRGSAIGPLGKRGATSRRSSVSSAGCAERTIRRLAGGHGHAATRLPQPSRSALAWPARHRWSLSGGRAGERRIRRSHASLLPQRRSREDSAGVNTPRPSIRRATVGANGCSRLSGSPLRWQVVKRPKGTLACATQPAGARASRLPLNP